MTTSIGDGGINIIRTAGNTFRAKTNADWVTEEDTPDPKVKRLLNEFVMIRPFGVTKETKSGIYIPEVTADREGQLVTIGKVIAVGEFAGKRNNVSTPTVGSYVLFPKNGGTRLQIDGVKVVIMYDDAIIAEVDKNQIS